MESKFYGHFNEFNRLKKTNNTFLSKLKFYELINYLKQFKLEKKN